MSSSGANLEKYRIPLEEIIRATNNFSLDTLIGDGGFGVVHKGQLSEKWQSLTVAIKRLNRDGYQGNNEFRHELKMVSSFHHPNIITFIGYCDDAGEMIIVYEYATNKSLDRHLQNPNKRRCITWAQRLKICLGVARGLKYLHSGLGEHMRVIHRDMKSANILLDENLDAKICDFGLSRFGPRNQPDSELLTKASGTRFYIDPIYNERGRLWKESDVYSFGVVLFEMSSGMLAYAKCFGEAKEQYLMDLVRSYYEDDQQDDELETLIDPILRGQVDMRSFQMFNEIAHECVNLNLKERPTMDRIIRKIEQALNLQLSMAEVVREGQKVEIMSQEQGFEDSYYTARVLQIHGGMCRVKYQTLKDDAGKTLIEDVPLDWVRPYPEANWQFSEFVSEDVVDVWEHEGWWKGVVVEKTQSGSYRVRFDHHQTRHGNHELTFPKTQLRLHTEWNPAGPRHWTFERRNWPWFD